MKLIASDYDGTIKYDGEGLLKDIEAIERWKKSGNLFAIISGRNAPSIREIAKNSGIGADYVLGDSGNTRFKDGVLHYSFRYSGKFIKPLCDILLSHKALYICVDLPDPAVIVYYVKNGEVVTNKLDSLSDHSEFSQVSAYFESGERSFSAAQDINSIFSSDLVALTNGDCIDIVPKGHTKAENIAELASSLAIGDDSIFTVGDNFNDIQMLDAFNSFVVSNAPDPVKLHAKLGIVSSVAEMIDILLSD